MLIQKTGWYQTYAPGVSAYVAQIISKNGRWLLKGALVIKGVYVFHVWGLDGRSLGPDGRYNLVVKQDV